MRTRGRAPTLRRPLTATPAARRPASVEAAAVSAAGGQGAVLALQQRAGNRAVTRSMGQRVIRRHSSWEHALLGDTPPKRLGMGLEQFQDEVLHDLCTSVIFPRLVLSAKGELVRVASSEMVEGGISADQT